MRSFRLAAVATLVLSGAGLALPVVSAHAVVTPVTTLSSTGPLYGFFGLGQKPLDLTPATGLGVSVYTGTPEIEFQWTDATSEYLELFPPNHTSWVVGTTFTISSSTTGGYWVSNISPCAPTGTVSVLQADTDTNGTLTDFAADLSLTCTSSAVPINVAFRFNSTVPYQAAAPDTTGWDFGDQPKGTDGWAHTFTVTNTGNETEAFGTPTLTGPGAAQFDAPTSTCGASVGAGATCTVTITPHPNASATSHVIAKAFLDLGLTNANVASAVPVDVEVNPVDQYPIYVSPGVNKITLHWTDLARELNATSGSVTILRGTSPTTLTVLKTDAPESAAASGVYVDSSVKTSVGYYYALQYNGLTTAPVAAEAWPSFTYGAFHPLFITQRIITGASLSGGHAYTFSVYGKGGIPKANIQSVALDLDVVSPSSNANLWVQKGGSKSASFWNLYLQKGAEGSTFAIVPVGSGGTVTVYLSSGSAKLNVDASGYFGLSTLTNEGTGSQFYSDAYPQTILNTKSDGTGALPAGYYTNADAWPYAVSEDSAISPTTDVSAVMVEITAYGSSKAGTLTAAPVGFQFHPGTELAYRPGVVTSTTAIISTSSYLDSANRFIYPAFSLLNHGSSSVQLIVTTLGYFDQHDDTFYGQRFAPTAAKHLFSATMTTAQKKQIYPGSYANAFTFGILTTMSALSPTVSTYVSVGAVGGGAPPLSGQLHPIAKQGTAMTTVLPTGSPSNEMTITNGAGSDPVNLWSSGLFNAWPQPDWPTYTAGGTPGGPVAQVVSARAISPRAPQLREAMLPTRQS